MMGILNVTPDSFTDGNQYIDLQKAVDHAKKMVTDGADIVDVGGYSTRPFADDVSVAEELDRVIPVIHSIRKEMPNCVISIDTFRSEVARNAVKFGASIINDISGGLLDNDMFQTASDLCVPIVIMHYRGTPKTMTKFIQYENVLIDVRNHLESRIQAATASGIPRWNIILDPGLGFAKTAEQSLRILRSFSQVLPINFPSLCGPSRKGFIGAITGKQIPSERDWGTSAAISACISGGADIVRVHNVHHLQDCLLVSDAIYRPPVVPDP